MNSVILEKVRRETLDLTECNCHPQTGSLHPAVMRVLGVLANHLKCTATLPCADCPEGFLSEMALVTTVINSSAIHFGKCHTCLPLVASLGASYAGEVREQRGADSRCGSSRAVQVSCLRV
jgi:hypothetical protein